MSYVECGCGQGATVARLRAEVARMTAEVESLKELHRMQLCAICVAAQCNTPESAEEQRIDKDNPYWTLAYSDVCAAVDREMALRAEYLALKQAVWSGVGADEVSEQSHSETMDMLADLNNAYEWHPKNLREIESLRTEIARLTAERDGAHARAEAAEARVAKMLPADCEKIITDLLAEGVMEAQCLESQERNRKRRETLARRILAALSGEDGDK